MNKPKPVRGTIHFTFVAQDKEEINNADDYLTEVLEDHDFFFDGGFYEVMDKADIIEDSPLDLELKAEREYYGHS